MSQTHRKEGGNGESSRKKNLGDLQKLESFQPGRPYMREQFSTSCRICHSAISREKLISPCLCKGSLAFVHLSCLERWLNQSGRDTCELCTFRFEAEQTRRYSICQGLRIWYRHPRHLSQLRADLVIGLVLTGVTLGLCSICIGGMKYFVLEGFRVGISYVWTEGVISFFLTIIILGYCTTIYLMMRDHIIPWYHWWNRCVNVRLILDLDLVPSIDPACALMTPSTETLMIPSNMSIIQPIKIDPEIEERAQNVNHQTIIFIPDISSTSLAQAQPVRAATDPPPSIPSVMSAIMSHIIRNSIEKSNLVAQHKVSKDSGTLDDYQGPIIHEDESKATMESALSTVIKISSPEVREQTSVASQLSQKTQSDPV